MNHKLTSRGQLVELINKYELETERVLSEEGTKMFRTILHRKDERDKDRFYKVKWGEVRDLDNYYHLWFDEVIEEVYPSEWEEGWHTKSEIKEINMSQVKGWESSKIETRLLLDEVSKSLVLNKDVNGIIFDRVETIGGLAGSGKTKYALIRVIEELLNNGVVLYFSTETKKEVIVERLIDLLKDNNVDDVDRFIESSNLVIVDKLELDDSYILNEMIEVNPDLVIVDVLQMVSSSDGLNNSLKVLDIHRKLDKSAIELDCEVLVTTQLNRKALEGDR